jgi:hypothetical protein
VIGAAPIMKVAAIDFVLTCAAAVRFAASYHPKLCERMIPAFTRLSDKLLVVSVAVANLPHTLLSYSVDRSPKHSLSAGRGEPPRLQQVLTRRHSGADTS